MCPRIRYSNQMNGIGIFLVKITCLLIENDKRYFIRKWQRYFEDISFFRLTIRYFVKFVDVWRWKFYNFIFQLPGIIGKFKVHIRVQSQIFNYHSLWICMNYGPFERSLYKIRLPPFPFQLSLHARVLLTVSNGFQPVWTTRVEIHSWRQLGPN